MGCCVAAPSPSGFFLLCRILGFFFHFVCLAAPWHHIENLDLFFSRISLPEGQGWLYPSCRDWGWGSVAAELGTLYKVPCGPLNTPRGKEPFSISSGTKDSIIKNQPLEPLQVYRPDSNIAIQGDLQSPPQMEFFTAESY